MVERLGRICVGLGLVWVFLVLAAFAVGLSTPDEWTPYLDRILSPDVRKGLHLVLTVVVVPLGMISLLKDVLGDPEPLWLKAAAPGAFAAVFATVLTASYPSSGQPILLMFDPFIKQVLPGFRLEQGPDDAASWFLRGLAAFVILAGIPGVLGGLAGALAGGRRRY